MDSKESEFDTNKTNLFLFI